MDVDHNPHRIISQTKGTLARIRAQFTRLQAEEQEAIRVIDEQRQILKARCKIHKRLPDELLFHIFLSLVEGDGLRQRYPWDLAAVCKRWRRICLDHPTLWSCINLEYDEHDCDENRYNDLAAFRTLLQLERSRNSPLTIIATHLCDCTSQLSRFQAALAQSHRWASASLRRIYSRTYAESTSEGDMLRRLLPPNLKLPNLRHLDWSVKGEVGPIEWAVLPFTEFVTSMENLRSLSLGDFLASVDLKTIQNVPWNQLTRLTLHYKGDHHGLLSVLSKCQDLVYLDLRFPTRDPAVTISATTSIEEDTIILRNVHEFVHIASPGLTAPILPYIRLPSLQRAGFRGLSSENTVKAIASLMRRSSCFATLTTLSLERYYEQPKPDLDPILQQCSSIRTLKLGNIRACDLNAMDTEAGDRFARSLAIDNNSTTRLCPRLQKLELNAVKVDPGILIPMIDSRLSEDRGDTQRLRRLRLVVPRIFKSQEDVRGFKFCRALFDRKYAADGLEISITLEKKK